MDRRIYLKNPDPSIDVCIHYGQFGMEEKTVHAICVRMCGVAKDLYPHGYTNASLLWNTLNDVINGRVEMTTDYWVWVSKVFWGKEQSCWKIWDIMECPFF
jgi:hypothetical protein